MGERSVFKSLREDIASIRKRDPAAGSGLEILLTYPGVHAMVFHRAAHRLHRIGLGPVAAMVAYLGRMITGIEVHPAAKIGRRFFIDHGTGVVIGGTAEIGDDVTLYQGVTLGGTSLEPGKRHPTLGDGVIVGAGATVLGPVMIGDYARIGANAVVLKDVPAYATAAGVPARVVRRRDAGATAPDFLPYGTPCDDLPDPAARALCGLMEEVQALRQRIEALETDRSTDASAGFDGATGYSAPTYGAEEFGGDGDARGDDRYWQTGAS